MIYVEKPQFFNSQMRVAALYVFSSDRILLLKRLSSKPQGDRFGLPAGKVDTEESILDALVREVAEETGLSVKHDALDIVDKFWVDHDGVQFEYHTYKILLNLEPSVLLRPNEHVDFCWATLSESLNLPLVEDQAFCIKFSFGL